MKTGYAVFGFVVVGALAFYVGYQAGQNKAQGTTAAPVAVADKQPVQPTAPAQVDLFNIQVGDAPCKGPADAKVTIIEFSEFQCPFCSRVMDTLKQVQDAYKDDVRICFKHNPLPFHKDAMPASEFAVEAAAQGKFWEAHDKLFANQKALQRENLEAYAQELGLDMAKVKNALDQSTHQMAVKRDQAEAARFGARGTPAFFINGAFLSGAQPFPKFKEAIDDAIKRADEVLAKGVSKGQLYAELVKGGKTRAEPPKPRPRPGEGTGRQLVEVSDQDQCKGPKNAKITIVEFSEFQCPFCSRVVPTMQQITDTYKNDVRVCFKHNPLPFHKDADLASQAALAAGAQGKFWPFHDKLFANQKALQRENLEAYAKELGLNMAKFKAALDQGTYKNQVEEDKKQAMKVGARGTPTFFINGQKIAGAQPFDNFKRAIDEDLKKADELIKKGTPAANVYAEMVKADPWKPAAAPSMPEDDGKPVDVNIKGSFAKGPSNAPVVIAEFSEFQCPFCARVLPTLQQLEKDYQGKIKIAFKHNPLPFHNEAENASKAALAAGEQGKFWEMHDKLFQNQKALNAEAYERFAKELGLNMAKFKADMESPKVAAAIQADKAEAAKVGARGTPTFFINGRRLVGAQPVERFKALIDEELKKK